MHPVIILMAVNKLLWLIKGFPLCHTQSLTDLKSSRNEIIMYICQQNDVTKSQSSITSMVSTSPQDWRSGVAN